MAGCLDNMPLLNVEGLVEAGDKRNKFASIISGILFFSGWWFAIDAAAVYPEKTELKDVFQICGVFGTISFFMVNAVSNEQLRGDSYTEGCLGVRSARVWFFFGFLLGFASLIGASWILFGEYVSNDCYEIGIKFNGGTATNTTSVVKDCQNICKGNSTCEYFSWDSTALGKWDGTSENKPKNCYLIIEATKPHESSQDGYYSGPKNCPYGRTFVPTLTYPGVAIFLQNFLIFVASLVYKFGRSEELWG